MIEGFCLGGGLAIALACDIRVAGQNATFALPPARLGLAYPLDGLQDLLAAIGLSAAKELLFSARRIPPAEALRIGLVDKVTDHPDKLDYAKMERVTRLAYWVGLNAANAKERPKRLGAQGGW